MFCWFPVPNCSCPHLYLFFIVWNKLAFRSHDPNYVTVMFFRCQRFFSQILKRNWYSWFMGVFECGEFKYDIYFLIGPFLLHTSGTFCSKKVKIRQKRQTMSWKKYFSANHVGFVQIINSWLCSETICGPWEWKDKYIEKESNSRTHVKTSLKWHLPARAQAWYMKIRLKSQQKRTWLFGQTFNEHIERN